MLGTHCSATQMFPYLPARATFVADTNFVSGTQKMFLILFRNILCPQQMFHSLRSPRNIMSNNVSTTMCPRLPVPLETPHYYGHSAATDTPLLRTPGYFGQPAVTDSPLLWTPQYYGNLTITDTPHYAQEKTCDENNFKKLLRIPAVEAAKHEIQKPSTCRATLFRCKFSSMFPVFHLV